MTQKPYDMLVFIGRFQPFHNGHQRVVDYALTQAEKVLILVGSSNSPRTIRNPFTFDERVRMIESLYGNLSGRVHTEALTDFPYNETRWIENVHFIVSTHCKHGKVGLIGCSKDNTSYYLKLFPRWDSLNVDFLNPINATDLRNLFWSYNTKAHWRDAREHSSELKEHVSDSVFAFLEAFSGTNSYREIKEENDFVIKYRQSVNKYPRIEQTVDSVVVQSGYILLIRRRAMPGKGKWALPGGFVNPDETLMNAAIRELKEETKIKVPEAVLRGSIKNAKTYDDPHRSARGRIITRAFHIELPMQNELPKVKGADDADKAKWVSLDEISRGNMFEDHFDIVDDMLGGI